MGITQDMAQESGLDHIVIVGGGAAGLELATRLGNKLGKRGNEPDLLNCINALETLARLITRRTEPHVKLH